MNGRVSRLLVTPLIRSLKKVLGDLDYLDYLDSYRYPLSGEFSMRQDVLNDLRILRSGPGDWRAVGNVSLLYQPAVPGRHCGQL